MDLEVGQLVSSKAGRDAGAKYIVIKKLDDNCVLVADGNKRKISHAKKKNIKHLVAHRQIATDIAQTINEKRKLTNQQLRLTIAALNDGEEDREEGLSDNG